MPIDSTVEEKLEAIRFILYQKKHLLHVQSPVIKRRLVCVGSYSVCLLPVS